MVNFESHAVRTIVLTGWQRMARSAKVYEFPFSEFARRLKTERNWLDCRPQRFLIPSHAKWLSRKHRFRV